jgi:hypothetical protein
MGRRAHAQCRFLCFALAVGAVLSAAIASGFLLNMVFVVVSRTALVTMPLMIAVFAVCHLRLRTTIVGLCAATLLAVDQARFRRR